MISYFSYGGGVQSNTALVLCGLLESSPETASDLTGLSVDRLRELLPYRRFIFCNVGNDSENPTTLDYVENIAKPFAKEHNIDLIEIERVISRGPLKGQTETILSRLTRDSGHGIPIPIRGQNGAPGNRSCTIDFKIRLTEKYGKSIGASPDNKAIVGLGISLDEMHRATGRERPHEILKYPLIDMRLRRSDCTRIIELAGLPIPPKSHCWFCPFHSRAEWYRIREHEPEIFKKAVELEQFINDRQAKKGRRSVYLTDRGMPLDQVIGLQTSLPLFERDDEADCNSGYCFV